MRYVSTRGHAAPLAFQDTVLEGLADDGGLFLPERIPDVRGELDSWRGLGFVELAARVMAHFVDDIDARVLHTTTAAQLCELRCAGHHAAANNSMT